MTNNLQSAFCMQAQVCNYSRLSFTALIKNHRSLLTPLLVASAVYRPGECSRT